MSGARFEVVEGSTSVVFGPNGAGKTTLLRRLAAELGDRAAYQPQQPYLFRGLVGANLGLGLTDEQAGLAGQYARRFGLGDLLSEPSQFLSGGERARVVLARVLARPEPVVLLDEPLAAIDMAERGALTGAIRQATRNRTAVIVTHELEQVVSLGDRLAVLIEGAVVQSGAVAEVMAAPNSEAVARSVGVANIIEGTVKSTTEATVTLESAGVSVIGSADDAVEGEARALIPAEVVTLLPARSDVADSARNHWQGTVSEMVARGRLIEVTIDIGLELRAIVTPGAVDSLALAVGTTVTAAAKASAVRIIDR